MSYNLCVLIPTYNHHLELPMIVQKLVGQNFDVLIVDDGSDVKTQECIKGIIDKFSKIHHLRLTKNCGKGFAVQEGLRYLKNQGVTHAFQIDADGQHSLENISDFIELSRLDTKVLISGNPVYDKSVPIARKVGRWFTHVWVWVETLSFRITDSMCGFRIYPIRETVALLDKHAIGARMDFDTEIMVRLFWSGIPVLMIPVKVMYPKGNTSNFRLLEDNWSITKMHTHLCFELLINFVKILRNRPNYRELNISDHSLSWASLEERGAVIGLYFLSIILKICGTRFCKIVGIPIVFYYYITGVEQRNASQKFLEKVFIKKGITKKPKFQHRFCHFMNFFYMSLDKFTAWTNQSKAAVDPEVIDSFRSIMANNTGGVLLVSHLGNMEFLRAIADDDHKNRLHVLLHLKNSKKFNQILKAFSPRSQLNIIEVTEVGADTIIYLKDRIAEGDWVVIAADRYPVTGDKRVSYVSFLGEKAPFSQGPYILASLLECQVYTAVAVKDNGKFKVFIELFSEKIILGRKEKDKILESYAQRYANGLETIVLKYYYQWFNFFDFWKGLR